MEAEVHLCLFMVGKATLLASGIYLSCHPRTQPIQPVESSLSDVTTPIQPLETVLGDVIVPIQPVESRQGDITASIYPVERKLCDEVTAPIQSLESSLK